MLMAAVLLDGTSKWYDGDVYFSTLSNAIVHMIMYSYYECTLFEIPVCSAWLPIIYYRDSI